jgi:hypothetical protein
MFSRKRGGLSTAFSLSIDAFCASIIALCQGKVEMSCRWQSRNVAFWPGLSGVHVNLRVPVKRRRAMLASNPIKE